MHELSLASSIAEIAVRHAAGHRVKRITVQVGHLCQVVPDALTFSFELVSAGTPLEGAALDLRAVPATGRCRRCAAVTTLRQFPLQCGACEGFDLEILTGEEFLVESLEVEEDDIGHFDRAAVG